MKVAKSLKSFQFDVSVGDILFLNFLVRLRWAVLVSYCLSFHPTSGLNTILLLETLANNIFRSKKEHAKFPGR